MEKIIAQIAFEMVEKILNQIETDGICNLSIMGEQLQKIVNECVLNLLKEIIESTDALLCENKRLRKSDHLNIWERDVPRTLTTVFGELNYKRTYFRLDGAEENPEYVYLTDLVIGVESYERLSKDLVAKLLSDIEFLSYADAAKQENAGTAQTVHNRLMASKELAAEVTKRKVPEKGLDLFADEDHAHMQPKAQSMVPLVAVTEGIENGSTVQPFFVQGYGMASSAIAENVLAIITQRYDCIGNTPIRLHCDGGSWIKTLQDVLPNVSVYMDGFHVGKYLRKLSKLKHGSKYLPKLRKALEQCDWDDFFVYGVELQELQDEDGKAKTENLLGYFHRNRTSIENRMKAGAKGVCGSCTEGLVSHVLSERLSRNPLSWSKQGLTKMASLLVYRKNGGKVGTGHIRVSVTEKERITEMNRFKQNGYMKYCEYADEQTKDYLQKKYDWSTLDPEKATFGKIDGTRVALSALGRLKNVLSA